MHQRVAGLASEEGKNALLSDDRARSHSTLLALVEVDPHARDKGNRKIGGSVILEEELHGIGKGLGLPKRLYSSLGFLHLVVAH